MVWQLGLQLIICKYFTREDIITPDFDWSQLEVEQQFFQYSQECSHVREEVTIYRYSTLDKRGEPVNDTVTVVKAHDVDIRTFCDASNPDKTGKNIPKLSIHLAIVPLFSIHCTQTKTQLLLSNRPQTGRSYQGACSPPSIIFSLQPGRKSHCGRLTAQDA